MTDERRRRAEELLFSAYSKIEAEQITGNYQYIIDAMLQFADQEVARERARCVEIAEYAERWIGDWEKRFGNKSVADAIRENEQIEKKHG